MTLTIPTTHAAVTDAPRFPCEVLCPRDGLCRVRLGGEWQLWPTRRFWHAAWMHASNLLDRGVTDWSPDECNWCRQHRCDVCRNKHRHCQRRWMATMRPQWRRESARIRASIREGHTSHCAKRLVWGDGECECNNGKIRTPPGSLSARLLGMPWPVGR